MSDMREALERGVHGLEPPGGGPDRIRHRARARRRRNRILTMVAALAMGAAATSWAIVAFRGTPEASPSPAVSPSPTAPLDVESLQLAWTADLPDAGAFDMGGEVQQDARHIYVMDGAQVVAFRKDCSDPCSPAWRGPVPTADPADLPRNEMVVGEGVVFVSNGSQLFAFASECARDGSECSPQWFADPPDGGQYLSSVLTSGSVVRATYSLGGNGNSKGVRAVAFEGDCRTDGGRCEPLWNGDMGSGTIYSPGTAVGDVFYQQVGVRMMGFAARCGADGATCQPSFEVDGNGDQASLLGPVAAGDELLITSSDGNVYAYAPHCGTSCQPLWFGEVADFLDSYPVMAGEQVVITTTGEMVAFPLACRNDGAECTPAWRADVHGYAPIVYADGASIVALDHRAGSITVFPADCSGSCRPRWSVELPGDPGEIASDGRHLFAGVGGTVLVYPLDCGDPCAPVSKAEVGGGAVQYLLVDDQGLFVGVVGGGIRLAAFLTGSDGDTAAVPSSETISLPIEAGHPSYGWIFRDVTASRAIGEWHVEWVQTWATDVFPGERTCNVMVWNAAGKVILDRDFNEASLPRRLRNGVSVREEPALFGAWCEEERLDAPLAYSITDVQIGNDGGSISFQVSDPGSLPPGKYVGTNQCIAAVFDPGDGHLYSTQYTLHVQAGRHEFEVEGAQAAGPNAVGIVRCEPFTGRWEHLTAQVRAAADQLTP